MTDEELTLARLRFEHVRRFQETQRDELDLVEHTFVGTYYQDRLRELALISASDVPALLTEIQRLRALLAEKQQ